MFVALGGLLVLALFAALIGPYFIDWSSYRTAFEKEASRIIGQKVTVRGAADARLLPFPSVTFSNVVVGDEAAPAMTAETFSMDAELAPFLSGEVLIFDMRVEKPSATVRILDDGTLDWALKRKPTPPGDLVVLEKVTIQDADIRVIDEQNGRTHRLENINALVSAKSLSGPWNIEAEGEVAGRRGAVSIATGVAQGNGSIRMRVRLAPDDWPALLETEGEARIEDNKPHYDGLFTFTGLAEAGPGEQAPERPLIVAKGDFKATNERLAVKEWRAEIGLSDDPYVVTGQATIDTGPRPEFLMLADGQQIDMSRLDGETAKTPDAPPAAMPLERRLALINALIDRVPPPPLPGRVSLNLPAIVAGDTTLRDISLEARPDAGAWLVDAFSASLPGRTVVEARGRLVSGAFPGFDGALTVASNQPSGLANWLVGDVDPVIRRLGAAGFSAKVSLSPALQRFEALEIAVGPAVLKGRLERQLPQDGPPSLSIDLAGDAFDVDAVRALALLADADSGASRPLADYNIAARIRADTLTSGDYRIGGFSTALTWRDRRLKVDSLEFADFGGASGNFSGALENPATAPRGLISGKLSAETSAGLFVLADRAVGEHQLIRRLAANAFAFDGLSADVFVELDPETGPVLEIKGAAGGSDIALSASGTGLTPGGDGPLTVKIAAGNPEAYRILEQLGFEVLPLEGEGPARLTLDLSGGADDGEFEVTARLASGDSSFALVGNGSLPALDPATGLFNLTIDVADIEPFALMFGQSPPQAGVGLPVTLSAVLAMNRERATLTEIDADAGGNAIKGNLDFDRTAAGLRGLGELRFDRADLGWIGELALGPRFLDTSGATWSDEAFLPQAPLRPSLEIGLEAGEIHLGRGGSATDFKARVTTATGAVRLEQAEADWFGGRIMGELALTNSAGAAFLSGRLSISGADLAAIERAVHGASVLSGSAGATVSLEGAGKSMREVVASLAGGGEFKADDLVIDGLDPNAFARILGTADREDFEITADSVGVMVAGLMAGGEVRADTLSLPFTLTGGVMRFSSAQIDEGGATLSGDARVDLSSLRLEADWRLSYEPGVEAIAGGDPSVAIGLGGLLADPAVSLDSGQMANYLSMRAFERERRKVELLQAGVIEKLRMRREIALLKERAARREEEARARAAAEEAARIAAEEEALRQAAEEEQLRLEEAQRQAEEAQRQAEEAQRQAEEAARLAEEQARLAEEAARQAEEERQRQIEEQARRAAEADAAAAAAEQQAAEEAARQQALEDPQAVIRRPLSDPLADPPSAIAPDPAPQPVPQLYFDNLPGVEDPIRSLIAPGG